MLAAALMLSLAFQAAHAQGQVSPYTVVVPVSDTTEGQRDEAFGTALSQVLARTSGGQDLRGKSGYAEALKGAAGIVQQYQYQKNAAGPGLALQVTFDQAAVQRTIAQMGVAGTAGKPPILLLVRDEDGSVLTKEALAPLSQAVAARGYSVVLADPGKAAGGPSVASADPEQIFNLAKQYKTGLVLLGQMRTGGADWNLISGGPQQKWSATGSDNSALFNDAGNALADRLGKQLNVIGSGNVDGKLWVTGVTSAADYATLLATLRADPMVRNVVTLSAQNDGMMLGMKTALPLGNLAGSLAATGRLLETEPHAGADASLRWVH
ncbi:DUF2066 domain-containing protein [Dyella terrae]|uniref:DUF2066 domain-containing protein n=3 Tax=Rhodanobacteraceae TaxID=1775411 RepID=A0A4R0YRD6_9GAMM|nr:DUF2066 domain-containing protein [Dyella terrae]TCI08685.1 DUF2066 domain-containing protein [Dyella soli]